MGGTHKRRDLLILLAVVAAVGLAIFLMPVLDGLGSHQKADEAVAVGMLRELIALQEGFAASNPGTGYACQLRTLKPAAPPNHEYDPYEFLVQDSHAGYRYSLANCAPDASGIVRTYQAIALPTRPGDSGIRAFCLDQRGIIWFDKKGSAAACLSSQKPLD